MLSDLQPMRDFRTLHADEPLNSRILQDALYSAHLNGSATLTIVYQSDDVPSWGSRTVLLRAGGTILRKVCTPSGAWTGHYKTLRFQVVARDIFHNAIGDDFPHDCSHEDAHYDPDDTRSSDKPDGCVSHSTQHDCFVITECFGFYPEHAIRQNTSVDLHANDHEFHSTLGSPVPPCVPLDSTRRGRTRVKPQFVEQRLACVFQRKDLQELYDKWSIGGPDKLPTFLFLLTEYSTRSRLTPVFTALGFMRPITHLGNLHRRTSAEHPPSDQQSRAPFAHSLMSDRFPLSIALAGLLNVVIAALDAVSRILRHFSESSSTHRRSLSRHDEQMDNVT